MRALCQREPPAIRLNTLHATLSHGKLGGSKRMVSVHPSGRAPPILLPEGQRKRADALVRQGRRR